MATLTKAIQPGFSLEHLRSALPNDSSGAVRVPVRSRSRSSFTTQALASLDQFEAALQLFEGVLDGMEMLVLAHCVLVQMDEHDRQTLAPLDTERAAALFLEQVFQGIDFQPFVDKLLGLACRSVAAAPEKIDPKEEAWLLPADIAPSEDLTFRARTAAQPAQLPYDGDRAYERVFDAVTRTFHSLQTRHVLLIGERGVGKTTVLAELARRAATGAVPLLAECRFVLVDCRYFAADEARPRLAGLLSRVVERPDLVVCLDGFASFLRAGTAGACKATLLTALPNARCRFVALLPPRRFEAY